jgi:hypothetical protein
MSGSISKSDLRVAWLGYLVALFLAGTLSLDTRAATANAVLVGWSEAGMHETDGGDVSIYSLFPPYSTLRTQLIVGGKLVTSSNGYSVTFQATADATGSVNSTSIGKGNFYQYAQALYGQALAPDQGLAGFSMPGPTNQPQPLVFDPTQNWFSAQGIPLTHYDDQGSTNSFPLMRLVARNSSGTLLASTDVVLPVSDAMDCRSCHASGSQSAARPQSGWIWDCDPVRDYKLNILQSHDEAHAGDSYTSVLMQVGYNPAGLVATVTRDSRPILCIRCHPSNALPGSGAPGMRPLTRLIHTKHAQVLDPQFGTTLDSAGQSAACMRCHAGPETSYLRGTHRNSVNADGSLAMPCQSCHGTLTDVGAKARQGWLDEPSCQSCHTGTASANAGQLRYTTLFTAPGQVRKAIDPTFATQTNAPSAGLSLFQFSSGHGGLKCAACHGPAHGEWASAQPNDNVESQQLQAHVGTLVECRACHPAIPSTANGGPHGMHPTGENWVRQHSDFARRNAECQSCHGMDYRGTALALSQSDQTLNQSERGGLQPFWRGFQIGCYNCHGGPSGEGDGFRNVAASVSNLSSNTAAQTPVSIALRSSDSDGDALSLRIISQPTHGTASLTGTSATYFPAPGFLGADSFTYAAWDGSTDSNLGSVSLNVQAGTCDLTISATAPAAALPGASIPFRASALLAQCTGTISYDWDYGDGTSHSSHANACHTYLVNGNYSWKLTVTVNGLTQVLNGAITVDSQLGPPVLLTLTQAEGVITVSWPADGIGTSLETTFDPTMSGSWGPVDPPPVMSGTAWSYQTPMFPNPQYFRVRRVP